MERNFSYAENNFLAGRTFVDWYDLNQRSLKWCDTVKGQKVPCKEEKALVGQCDVIDRYVDGIKKRSRGTGKRKLQRLLDLKRTYPAAKLSLFVSIFCAGFHILSR